MSEVFIGRQPVFDRDLGVAFYELLYRSSRDNVATFTNSEHATSEVLVNSLMEIGLERIAGDRRVFINLTREYVVGDWPVPLDKNRVGIELVEGQLVDQALIDALTERSREGCVIALDDFVYKEHLRPLLYIADLVKLDVQALGRDGVVDQYRLLRRFPVKLVAEKVETRTEFEFYHKLGFDYFQGHFISRPRVISGKAMSAQRVNMLLLLGEIQDPDVSLERLERLISGDVGLSYKLLRYINSAFFNLPRKVESVREAIIYLGLRPLKVWVSLIIVSSIDDQPEEVKRQAIIRARLCENLARHLGENHPGRFFTVGLFSSLDTLLDMPMDEVLANLPLSDDIKQALLDGTGLPGQVLACARGHEKGRWEAHAQLDLVPDDVNLAYLEAIEWAEGFSRLVG